jgi:hypothetical protein
VRSNGGDDFDKSQTGEKENNLLVKF